MKRRTRVSNDNADLLRILNQALSAEYGTLYLLPRHMAEIEDEEIKERLKINEVYMEILSQIGRPIDEPLITTVKLVLDKGISFQAVKSDVKEIVRDELSKITKLTDMIINEGIEVF